MRVPFLFLEGPLNSEYRAYSDRYFTLSCAGLERHAP